MAAPRVVVTTISGANMDEKVGIMASLGSLCSFARWMLTKTLDAEYTKL